MTTDRATMSPADLSLRLLNRLSGTKRENEIY